jgi:DNA-binding NtrC family response regulator
VKGRILVIDDEPGVGRTFQRLLGDAHDVTVLSSGRDAIGLLDRGEEFDVIFCDLSMPEVSGMDVYRAAVATRSDLAHRFIFISGGIYSSRFGDFLESISNDRLDKPFELESVRALVRARITDTAALEKVG